MDLSPSYPENKFISKLELFLREVDEDAIVNDELKQSRRKLNRRKIGHQPKSEHIYHF